MVSPLLLCASHKCFNYSLVFHVNYEFIQHLLLNIILVQTVISTVDENVSGRLNTCNPKITFKNNSFLCVCRDSKDRNRLWGASHFEGLPPKVYECLCPHFLCCLLQRKVSRNVHPKALTFVCALLLLNIIIS